jgi:hypothetical protein
MMFFSEMKYFEKAAKIVILLDPPHRTITMTIHYGVAPTEKMTVLYEMLNQINMYLCTCHYVINPEVRALALLSGFYFEDGGINKSEFQRLFQRMLADSQTYGCLIARQIESDRTPADLFMQFVTENKDRLI